VDHGRPSIQTTNVHFAPILLKKSFLVDERDFLAPLVRPKRCDVRGPHGFLQKRSLTTAPMLKRLAAAETTKN
jgi:hypothetical protein